MRDVLWTIIGIWVFYKLYSSLTRQKTTTVYQKHDHHHYHQDDEIKINTSGNKKSSGKIDDSEYTDFEEIK